MSWKKSGVVKVTKNQMSEPCSLEGNRKPFASSCSYRNNIETDVSEKTYTVLDSGGRRSSTSLVSGKDESFIRVEPDPLSMLEVIDGSEGSMSGSAQEKHPTRGQHDFAKIGPTPISMLEGSSVVDSAMQNVLHSACRLGDNGASNTVQDGGMYSRQWVPPDLYSTTINNVQMFHCPVCGESYSLLLQLRDHMATHLIENPYTSKYFDLTLYDNNGIVNQFGKKGQDNNSSNWCNICMKSFLHSSALKRHMKTHDNEKPHVCTECGKCYSEVSYLKRHLLTHAGNNQNNFCSICNSQFSDVVLLREHIQMHAASVKPHSCMVCGKLYTRVSVLKRHVMLHFNDSSQPGKIIENIEDDIEEEDVKEKPKKAVFTGNKRQHVCSVCSKGFNSLGNLQRHHRIHTGEKPYSCSICGSCFSQLSHLRQHHQTHTDVKLICPVCSVAISNDRNFKRHIKLHTGERPFKCSTCSATFTQQSHLKKHIRTHSSNSPSSSCSPTTTYRCSLCKATFTEITTYKEHIRNHASDTPYSCSICDRKFTDIDQLKDHVETHSDEQQGDTKVKSTDQDLKDNECNN